MEGAFAIVLFGVAGVAAELDRRLRDLGRAA
jgi:hypothetical protein